MLRAVAQSARRAAAPRAVAALSAAVPRAVASLSAAAPRAVVGPSSSALWLAAAMQASCAVDGDRDGVTAPAADASGDAPAADADGDAVASDVGADAASDADTDPLGAVALWPVLEPVQLDAAAFRRHEAALGRISRFSTQVTRGARPPIGTLGALGLGNGDVFGFVGYADPLNTLHTMAGPTYDKADGFFGDYAIRVYVGGEAVTFAHERAARALDAPVALTRAESDGGLRVSTLDFVPWTDGPERRCFARLVSVEGIIPAETVLVVDPHNVAAVEGDAIVERRAARTLATRAGTPGATASTAGLILDVPIDGPSEHVVLHCAGGEVPEEAIVADVATVDGWLDETSAAYRGWASRLTTFELPDASLQHFVDGMKQTLITQTTRDGATCPMSQYSRTWARDNIGPALAWLQFGGHDELRAMIDYVYSAILRQGDFANSYAADLPVDLTLPPPDWASLPTLAPRVAAETPSYMVWILGAYTQATGDLSLATTRWGYVRRAQWAQAFDALDLLPFTDDETYRAAMNAAFGLALEFPHGEQSQSANSSFLWLGAARWYAAMAEWTGRTADVAEVEARAVDVEAAALETYLRDDGCFAALRTRETGALSPPYEDVSLQPTWVGWLDGTDPRARANVACLMETLSPRPGVVLSPIHPRLRGLPLVGAGEGIYTGMLPGYTLSALTAVGHPDAEAALVEMATSVDTSGNFQEYLDASLPGGLQLLYDATGAQGDYTAKFRPWEGGINVAAVLDYLFGYEGDAVRGRVQLRPHLPARWNGMAMRGFLVGASRGDVVLTRASGDVVIEVTAAAGGLPEVEIAWDHAGAAPTATLDGASAAPTSTFAADRGWLSTARYRVPALAEGETATLRIAAAIERGGER